MLEAGAMKSEFSLFGLNNFSIEFWVPSEIQFPLKTHFQMVKQSIQKRVFSVSFKAVYL